ncbi:MAG: hypothetical protein JRG96_18110 [Deltaproteobacteria bacterium]|nr:hypothetical protein [Deltaproteobacteria bacterium]
MRGSRWGAADPGSIGRDYSQVAIDGANEAHMSVPPGPPGRIILGYDSAYGSQGEAVTTDAPADSRNGVAV